LNEVPTDWRFHKQIVATAPQSNRRRRDGSGPADINPRLRHILRQRGLKSAPLSFAHEETRLGKRPPSSYAGVAQVRFHPFTLL
jgi:hypothetical protein